MSIILQILFVDYYNGLPYGFIQLLYYTKNNKLGAEKLLLHAKKAYVSFVSKREQEIIKQLFPQTNNVDKCAVVSFNSVSLHVFPPLRVL